MLPESVLNTLAGGFIGLLGGLAFWLIRDSLEKRKRRKALIDAIDSATRSCSTPAVMAAFTGRRGLFNPAAQFLSAFWRDLPLLGTHTQMITITFFSTVIDLTGQDTSPSKEQLNALRGIQEELAVLLNKERRGERQHIVDRSKESEE